MTRIVSAMSIMLLASALVSADVTIVVDPGAFDTIERAASGEKQVDFWVGAKGHNYCKIRVLPYRKPLEFQHDKAVTERPGHKNA